MSAAAGGRLRPGDLLQAAARAVVAGNLIVLALPKIAEPALFLKGVREYGILPEDPPWMLNLVAVVLPWIELLGGFALALGAWRRGVAAAVGGMLAVFTTAILLRALEVHAAGGISFCEIAFDCGCGSGEVVICEKLAYNALLIACCVFTVLWPANRLTLPPGAWQGPQGRG